MRAYKRIEFGFDRQEDLHKVAIAVRKALKRYGVEYSWWLFEPHVELTWVSTCKDDIDLSAAINCLREYHITDYLESRFSDSKQIDWLGKTPIEREFGNKVRSLSSDIATQFYLYQKTLQNNQSFEVQAQRMVHRIFNPMGIGGDKEIRMLFKECFRMLSFRYKRFARLFKWIERKIRV